MIFILLEIVIDLSLHVLYLSLHVSLSIGCLSSLWLWLKEKRWVEVQNSLLLVTSGKMISVCQYRMQYLSMDITFVYKPVLRPPG